MVSEPLPAEDTPTRRLPQELRYLSGLLKDRPKARILEICSNTDNFLNTFKWPKALVTSVYPGCAQEHAASTTYDIILVDGSANKDVVFDDLKCCLRMSSCETIILMGNVNYSVPTGYNKGATAAWLKLLDAAEIVETNHFEPKHAALKGRGFSVGKTIGVQVLKDHSFDKGSVEQFASKISQESIIRATSSLIPEDTIQTVLSCLRHTFENNGPGVFWPNTEQAGMMYKHPHFIIPYRELGAKLAGDMDPKLKAAMSQFFDSIHNFLPELEKTTNNSLGLTCVKLQPISMVAHYYHEKVPVNYLCTEKAFHVDNHIWTMNFEDVAGLCSLSRTGEIKRINYGSPLDGFNLFAAGNAQKISRGAWKALVHSGSNLQPGFRTSVTVFVEARNAFPLTFNFPETIAVRNIQAKWAVQCLKESKGCSKLYDVWGARSTGALLDTCDILKIPDLLVDPADGKVRSKLQMFGQLLQGILWDLVHLPRRVLLNSVANLRGYSHA